MLRRHGFFPYHGDYWLVVVLAVFSPSKRAVISRRVMFFLGAGSDADYFRVAGALQLSNKFCLLCLCQTVKSVEAHV